MTDARILYLSLLTDGTSSNLSKLHCLISLSGEIVLWSDKANTSVILNLAEACHIYDRKDLGVQITVSEKGEPVGCHICQPALRRGSPHTGDLSLHWIRCHKEPHWQYIKFSELLSMFSVDVCIKANVPEERVHQKLLEKCTVYGTEKLVSWNTLLENSKNSEWIFCFFLLALLQQAEYKNAFSQHSSETPTVLAIILLLLLGMSAYYWNKRTTEKKTNTWLWDELT